jgi:hypothetical protein
MAQLIAAQVACSTRVLYGLGIVCAGQCLTNLTLDDPYEVVVVVAEPSAQEKLDFEVNNCYAPSLPLRNVLNVPRV